MVQYIAGAVPANEIPKNPSHHLGGPHPRRVPPLDVSSHHLSTSPLLMDYIFFRNKNITIALPENKRLWNIRVMSTIIGEKETIPKILEMRLDEFKLIIQGRVGNILIKIMLRFARVLWKVLEETLCPSISSNDTPGMNIPMHKQQLQWYKKDMCDGFNNQNSHWSCHWTQY